MPHFKTSRGLDWFYERKGSGPAVLMIHGFGGNHQWWQQQIDFLSTDFDVIAVDLPGHGQSAWMPVSLKDMAADLVQILKACQVQDVSVVACSFGGLIAMELYRLMPFHVMRISFAGAIPKFARSAQYPAGLDIDKIRTLSGQFDKDLGPVLDMFFRSLFTMKEREGESFKWVKAMHKQMALPRKEALKYFLDILEKTDLRDRLSSMICPLQYITGQEDYICPPAIMEWVKEHSYNARFDLMAGCGHLPFLTEVDEYNRLLEDFLLN